MSKTKVGIFIFIGTLVTGGTYLLMRKKEQKRIIVKGCRQPVYRRVVRPADTNESPLKRVVSQDWLKPGPKDIEFKNTVYKAFLDSMDRVDSAYLIHSLLTIKKHLELSSTQEVLEVDYNGILHAFEYAITTKMGRDPLQLGSLAETTADLKAEILALIDYESEEFVEAANELERAIRRNEGEEIHRVKKSHFRKTA